MMGSKAPQPNPNPGTKPPAPPCPPKPRADQAAYRTMIHELTETVVRLRAESGTHQHSGDEHTEHQAYVDQCQADATTDKQTDESGKPLDYVTILTNRIAALAGRNNQLRAQLASLKVNCIAQLEAENAELKEYQDAIADKAIRKTVADFDRRSRGVPDNGLKPLPEGAVVFFPVDGPRVPSVGEHYYNMGTHRLDYRADSSHWEHGPQQCYKRLSKIAQYGTAAGEPEDYVAESECEKQP